MVALCREVPRALPDNRRDGAGVGWRSSHKYLVHCDFTGTLSLYSHALAVFALADYGSFFVCLQSSCHMKPGLESTSGSLETRMRYTPSDCFETFPFPQDTTRLAYHR